MPPSPPGHNVVPMLDPQAHLAAIVEGSDDAILSKTMDGTITSWNRAAERLYGYTAREAIGRPVSIIIPDDRPDEFPLIMNRLRRGQRVEHYETVRQRKDGTPINISLTVSPIRDTNGGVVGASAIARDITAQKRLEQERIALLEQEQAARAAAETAIGLRDRFLAMAAHELRTPLTPLRGSLQLLRRQLARGVQAVDLDRLAARAEQQQERLTRLVTTLLDVTRLESGRLALEMHHLDFADLTQRVVDQVTVTWVPPREIPVRLPDGPVMVSADESRVEQVLVNLLENARKYSPDDRPITVELRVTGESACLSVQDEGIGIPEDEQGLIFDRFHRAGNIDPHTGGFGLGLYFARQIAEAHGGSLTVRSAPNTGSTFILSLPLSESESAAAS